MPQGANVRCVAWSAEDNFLACGCENGMLKVLKIEGAQPVSGSTTTEKNTGNPSNGNGSNSNRGPLANRGLLAAPSNIAMNQTLEGHSSNIQVNTITGKYSQLFLQNDKLFRKQLMFPFYCRSLLGTMCIKSWPRVMPKVVDWVWVVAVNSYVLIYIFNYLGLIIVWMLYKGEVEGIIGNVIL